MIHELMVFCSMLLLQRKNGFQPLMHRTLGRGLVIYFFLEREEGNKSSCLYICRLSFPDNKKTVYYFQIDESVGMNMLYIICITNLPEEQRLGKSVFGGLRSFNPYESTVDDVVDM